MTKTTVREISYLEAVREAMSQEMRENQDVFILGEDIGVYGGAFGVTRGMIEEFGPERVRNTPISEAAIAGGAVGAALTGMRPILELQFSDFITIAMDQLVNQAAKTRYMFGGKGKVPLVVRTPKRDQERCRSAAFTKLRSVDGSYSGTKGGSAFNSL